jgi:hypothetical protein
VTIELPFERNTAYLSAISGLRTIIFVQNSSIEVNGRSTVSLGRTPSVRSKRVPLLLSCEN